MAALSSAQAASAEWTNGAADNLWQSPTNWNPSVPGATSGFASTDDATFSSAGSGVIDLGGTVNVRTLIYGVSGGDAAAFTVGDANDTLSFTTGGGITVNAGVTTSQTVGTTGTTINLSNVLSATDTFTNNGSGVLTIAGNLVQNAPTGSSTTVNSSLLTVTGTGNTTVAGTITNAGAAATTAVGTSLLKTGSGTLTLSNGSVWAGNAARATDLITNQYPLTVREGTLLLNGGTHTVTGEAVIGGFTTAGAAGNNAKIQVDAGALNISGFLSVGRGNGVGGVLSVLELNNSAAVTSGFFSAGFNGGNVANLPKGTITLNGNSSLTVSQGTYVAESAGSDFTINVNGTSTFRATSTAGAAAQVARFGMANGAVGTLNVNGGTAIFERDVVLGYAGTGKGRLNLTSGTVNVASTLERWMIINGGTGANSGEVTVSGGNLNLNTNTDLRFGTNAGSSGTSVFTLSGGSVSGYTGNNNGVFSGTSLVDLNNASTNTGINNTFNLDGGILTIGQVVTGNNAGTAAFNFNGGTLRAAAASTNFVDLGGANQKAFVKTGGAIIDSNGVDITIVQALEAASGSNGGLNKIGAGTLTLSGVNTYAGNTTVTAGTLSLASTGTLLFTINNNGTSNQLINSAGTVNLDGKFNLNLSGAVASNSWTLVTGAVNYGGTFSVFDSATSSAFTNNAGIWSYTNGVGNWSFSQSSGQLSFTAVPEPHEYAVMIAGMLAIVIGLRRRRAVRA